MTGLNLRLNIHILLSLSIKKFKLAEYNTIQLWDEMGQGIYNFYNLDTSWEADK